MIRRILVPLDGSSLAEGALSHAIAISRAFGAEIVLLRVLETDWRASDAFVDSVDWRMGRAEAVAYLDRLTAGMRAEGLRAQRVVTEGRAAESIVEFAHDHGIDLIALCSHGQGGLSEFHLSSTTQKVIERAGVSICLVPATRGGPADRQALQYRTVLVPVDCSHRAEWALSLAATVARAHRSELLMIHVVPVPEMTRRMPLDPEDAGLARRVVESNRKAAEAYLEDMRAELSAPALAVRSLVVVATQVAQAVQRVAEDEQADLMVLSAHGCSGGERWPYGSVAGSLLLYGTTPLVVFQDLPCGAKATRGTVDVAAAVPAYAETR